MRFSDLAEAQQQVDAQRTRRFPWLTAVKRERLLVSPHAFLRGSAPLFYQLLRQLKLGSLTHVQSWIVGDMHVENVGAYRTDDDSVVFDLNDFDAAGIGPVVYDVLRLLTSVLLTGRSFALNGPHAIQLARATLDAWQTAAATGRVPTPSESIRMIRSEAEQSPFGAYLDERAPERNGKRRFQRGERYHALIAPWTKKADPLLHHYAEALGDRAPSHGYALVDAAHRIAGTGSLGGVRIAYVVAVKGDTHRLVELKEAQPPAVRGLGGPKDDALRIVTGANALVAAPPRGLAALPQGAAGVRFIGRRLEPQQQKLNLMKTPRAELETVFTHIGGLTGRAHRRAAAQRLGRFSAGEMATLLGHAVTLAGIHEATYLSYSL